MEAAPSQGTEFCVGMLQSKRTEDRQRQDGKDKDSNKDSNKEEGEEEDLVPRRSPMKKIVGVCPAQGT